MALRGRRLFENTVLTVNLLQGFFRAVVTRLSDVLLHKATRSTLFVLGVKRKLAAKV